MSKNDELCARYAIDARTLEARRKFLHLDTRDAHLLASLVPWIRKRSDGIAKAFYDWQFAFAPTRQFFEAFARQHKTSLEVLRQQLESTQSRYLIEVFEGADEQWSLHYYEKRLQVGRLHDKINLPFKWYMGAYVEYERLLLRELRQSFWWRPGFAHRVHESVRKVFNYDQQAIGDSFILSIFQSIGLEVESIPAGSGIERAENLAIAKSWMGTLQSQANAIASGKLSDPVLKTRIDGTLGHAFQEMVDSLHVFLEATAGTVHDLARVSEQISVSGSGVADQSTQIAARVSTLAAAAEEMSATVNEIARSTTTTADDGRRAGALAKETGASVKKLGESSKEISRVVEAIGEISEQTKLLALNATIEAARAGEAGKGFAVVAHEVKDLAKQAADSTSEIDGRVSSIQDATRETVSSIEALETTISEVSAAQQSIAAAIEEQSAAIKEIVKSIAEISRSTGETNQEAQAIGGQSSQVRSQAARLEELIRRYEL